jgi:hypothetical protein
MLANLAVHWYCLLIESKQAGNIGGFHIVMFQVWLFRFSSGPGNLSNFWVDSGSGLGTQTRRPKYVSGSSN